MQWLHRHTMEKNKNGGKKKRKMVLQIKDIGKGMYNHTSKYRLNPALHENCGEVTLFATMFWGPTGAQPRF